MNYYIGSCGISEVSEITMACIVLTFVLGLLLTYDDKLLFDFLQLNMKDFHHISGLNCPVDMSLTKMKPLIMSKRREFMHSLEYQKNVNRYLAQ